MTEVNPTRGDSVAYSIVVPVFNERESLPVLDSELRAVLSTLPERSELIYIDDGSTDDSREVLARLAASQRSTSGVKTRLIHLRSNQGQTAALAAGFDASNGHVIIPLDADGQNNPVDIPRLLDRLEDGFDVVSGWRRKRRESIMRRLPSRVANWLIGRASGLALHDYGCTLKAYRAEFLKGLRLYGDMHRFIPLYLARMGARVTEIEVDHRARKTGESKYGPSRLFKVFPDLFLVAFMSRFYLRPMHFFGQATIFFLALSLLVGFTMLVFKFGWLAIIGIDYRASFVETPLPALAGTFLLGAVVALFFGILGELLTRIHHESQGLPAYFVDSVSEPEDRA